MEEKAGLGGSRGRPPVDSGFSSGGWGKEVLLGVWLAQLIHGKRARHSTWDLNLSFRPALAAVD